jgi:hypothetical protein
MVVYYRQLSSPRDYLLTKGIDNNRGDGKRTVTITDCRDSSRFGAFAGYPQNADHKRVYSMIEINAAAGKEIE